jgi:chromatin remodeling complex protein RSC6
MSLSMKGSERMASKRVQATQNSTPDPRRYTISPDISQIFGIP